MPDPLRMTLSGDITDRNVYNEEHNSSGFDLANLNRYSIITHIFFGWVFTWDDWKVLIIGWLWKPIALISQPSADLNFNKASYFPCKLDPSNTSFTRKNTNLKRTTINQNQNVFQQNLLIEKKLLKTFMRRKIFAKNINIHNYYGNKGQPYQQKGQKIRAVNEPQD